MKLIVLLTFLSFNMFSQEILNCHDPREFVDSGTDLSLTQTSDGIEVKLSETTFAGRISLASFKTNELIRIDYSKLSTTSKGCVISLKGSEKTKFGEKSIRVNIFKDGFVGMSFKEYVYGYMYCSYLQELDPSAICTPGGSDELKLVNEKIQTTKDFSYAFKNDDHVYSVIQCESGVDFNMLADKMNCDEQTDVAIKIDLNY